MDAIIQGVREGDLKVKYLNNNQKIAEYVFDDTINIELSYNTQFGTLNNHHNLTVVPLTSNLKVTEAGHNRYQLVIDLSQRLNKFEYKIGLSSDKCLFKSNYPKVNFTSETDIVFKTYDIEGGSVDAPSWTDGGALH